MLASRELVFDLAQSVVFFLTSGKQKRPEGMLPSLLMMGERDA